MGSYFQWKKKISTEIFQAIIQSIVLSTETTPPLSILIFKIIEIKIVFNLFVGQVRLGYISAGLGLPVWVSHRKQPNPTIILFLKMWREGLPVLKIHIV